MLALRLYSGLLGCKMGFTNCSHMLAKVEDFGDPCMQVMEKLTKGFRKGGYCLYPPMHLCS